MMGEVSLSRIEQLLLGVSCELRPALAVGDPTVAVLDCGHLALVAATLLHLTRPTESVGVWNPGLHDAEQSLRRVVDTFPNR